MFWHARVAIKLNSLHCFCNGNNITFKFSISAQTHMQSDHMINGYQSQTTQDIFMIANSWAAKLLSSALLAFLHPIKTIKSIVKDKKNDDGSEFSMAKYALLQTLTNAQTCDLRWHTTASYSKPPRAAINSKCFWTDKIYKWQLAHLFMGCPFIMGLLLLHSAAI